MCAHSSGEWEKHGGNSFTTSKKSLKTHFHIPEMNNQAVWDIMATIFFWFPSEVGTLINCLL